MIKKFEKSDSKSKLLGEPEAQKLDLLKLTLYARQTQMALWYNEYLDLERKVSQLAPLLAIKSAETNNLIALVALITNSLNSGEYGGLM